LQGADTQRKHLTGCATVPSLTNTNRLPGYFSIRLDKVALALKKFNARENTLGFETSSEG